MCICVCVSVSVYVCDIDTTLCEWSRNEDHMNATMQFASP